MESLVTDITVDDLEQVIVRAESLIAQLRASQIEALTLLDAAQVAQQDGSRTMVEWTSARLDVTHATARDLMTLAKASSECPALKHPLDLGTATFDRAVATARLATSGASADTIEYSAGFDLGGMRRMTARHRRITKVDERKTFLEQYVAIQPTLDYSAAKFWGQLPGFEARVFEKALRQRADQFNDLPGPKMRAPMRMANALVSIAQDSLGGAAAQGPGADPLVSVFVDAMPASATNGEAGADVEFGPRVGPATPERILCSGAVQVVVKDGSRPVVASDARRAIPPATRRYVAWRDGGCTIDGCRSRYRLEPHHVRRRADGGSHDPANLTVLCWYHHNIAIHGSGFRVDPNSPPQRRRLLPPTGSDPPAA